MQDLEKAKTLLIYLNKCELKFKDVREASSFLSAYQWLLDYAKKLEKEGKKQ